MITRLSIAFEDFLGSSIAPQVMPPCWLPHTCAGLLGVVVVFVVFGGGVGNVVVVVVEDHWLHK